MTGDRSRCQEIMLPDGESLQGNIFHFREALSTCQVLFGCLVHVSSVPYIAFVGLGPYPVFSALFSSYFLLSLPVFVALNSFLE